MVQPDGLRFLVLSPAFPRLCSFFFFQAEDGIRDLIVTGVQTCALPILAAALAAVGHPVIVDCGRAERGAALAVAAAADASLLVVRPCYLALRRALAEIGRASCRERV